MLILPSDRILSAVGGSKTRRRRRAPDDKRSRILDAATVFLSSNGADAMRMSDLAKTAEVSEGIIFHHFGNKRGLLKAVAARHGHSVAVAMFEGILPGQPPDVERMIRAKFRHSVEHGQLEQMLLVTDDTAGANQNLKVTHDVVIAALAQAFIGWRAAGFIETEHPEIAASLMVGLVSHGVRECVLHKGGENMEAYIQETVACVEGALGYMDSRKEPK